jgi:hypothetical protein
MDFDFKSIATAVTTTVVLAVLAWVWLQFTIYGRTVWQSLGRSEVASRWVAVIAFAAFMLGLIALLGPASPIWSQSSLAIVAVSKRIGINGAESTKDDPGYFGPTVGGNQNFIHVSDSDGSQICTLSNIVLESGPSNGGACELHYDGTPDGWRIRAAGALRCRVTCFKLSGTK